MREIKCDGCGAPISAEENIGGVIADSKMVSDFKSGKSFPVGRTRDFCALCIGRINKFIDTLNVAPKDKDKTKD